MKKLLFLVCLIALISSCSKEENSVAPDVSMRSAVKMLSSAKEWRLSDIYIGEKQIFANGKPLDGKKIVQVTPTMTIEFDSILEKAIFGENGSGKVKYVDGVDFEDFKYEIDDIKKLLIIKNENNDEQYRIAGGSIQSTQFTLEDNTDNANLKLILKSN